MKIENQEFIKKKGNENLFEEKEAIKNLKKLIIKMEHLRFHHMIAHKITVGNTVLY